MSRVAWTAALLMLCGAVVGASATATARIVRPGEEFQTYPSGASPEERSLAAAKAAQDAALQAKQAAETIKRAIASIPRPPPPGQSIADRDQLLGNLDLLAGDTPVRQAQRHRVGGRAARFQQVFNRDGVKHKRRCKRRRGKKSRRHRKERDGPAWNRVTGAAKKYDPNDQMCAICQFLTQRIQLDMAHFNAMGNFLGAQTAAASSAAGVAAGATPGKAKNDDFFLELDAKVTPTKAAAAEAEVDTGMISAFLQVGQKVTLKAGGVDAVSGLSWAEADALEARQLELQAKADLYEKSGDWDQLEQLENQRAELKETMRLAQIEAKEEADEEDEEEDSEDSEDEEESEEEEDSEDSEEDSEEESEDEDTEEEQEEETAAPEVALAETESVVAAGLSAVEKQEMEEALQETRTLRVASSIRKTIDAGVAAAAAPAKKAAEDTEEEGQSSFLEKAAGETEVGSEELDMLSKEDQDQLLEALDKKAEGELSLTQEERAEMAQMMSGEKDADALDYATPTYTGPAAEAEDLETISDEDLAFVELGSDVDDQDSTSEELDETESEQIGFDDAADDEHNTVALPVSYRDAPANPNARRSYARTLHRAELTPTPTVFAETTGQHRQFMSSEGRFAASLHHGSASAKSRRPKRPKGIGLANSPRRFRLADALYSRPRWNRFDPTVQPHPNPQREQARQMWEKLLHMTYDRLEGYCSTRLPEQFSPFCRPMLRKFRVVAEGLRYGDRPNQICMRTRFCPRGSYVRKSAHNVFKIVPRRHRG